jgi:hypothetical protein
MRFAAMLIDSSVIAHGGGLCRDIVESEVCVFWLGMRLPLYRALDADIDDDKGDGSDTDDDDNDTGDSGDAV